MTDMMRSTTRSNSSRWLGMLFGFAGMLSADVGMAGETSTDAPVAQEPRTYTVVDNMVDAGTLRGWQIYHTTCYACHGMDATGTDIAPSLVDRLADMNVRKFTTTVLARYRITLPWREATAESTDGARRAIVDEMMRQERGKRGELVMPAWKGDPKVHPHLLDLYSYLRARADGVLGPGRPKLLLEH